ncbi:hypothetical protein E4U43_004509 [Claviceps pusilla]|uniref:BTB domain-containing protein n=1 Tax=Claviceps pusilla TaxID=123648 RepID=A0A9P7SWZ5_9HYPO|nr:hypothetical protein E4U43_004509 [Claviceps pusilla]
MAKSPDWVLDQDGDLTLVVGTRPPQTMKVDSRALCRSSSVFSKMLKGPFLESRPRSRAWEVKLPEDDPQALLIIMDIIHNQYKHAPTEPALYILCRVLSLSSKYDMAKSLRSMWHAWLEQAREATGPYETLWGKEAYLFVAFELGDNHLFGNIATRLAIECKVNNKGEILTMNGRSRLVDNEFVKRTNVVGELETYRLRCLSLMQSACQHILHSFSEEYTSEEGTKKNHAINNARDALIGYILKQSRKQKIAGLFLPSLDGLGSTWRIDDLLKKLQIIMDEIPQRTYSRSKLDGCEIREEINKILPQNFSGLHWHKYYMARQAEATQTRLTSWEFRLQRVQLRYF